MKLEIQCRNYGGGPKWIPAIVECCTGPLSYKTALGHGQTVKKHVDQIRNRSTGKMLETVLPTENEQYGDTSALPSADVVNAPAEKAMSALEKGQSLELTVGETKTKQPTNLRRSAREMFSGSLERLCSISQVCKGQSMPYNLY